MAAPLLSFRFGIPIAVRIQFKPARVYINVYGVYFDEGIIVREHAPLPDRIVLTGGGTAGHVTPNLALIPRCLKAGWEVHYIGSHDGIERDLAGSLPGVAYHAIRSGKLRRYSSIRNLTDPFRVAAGVFEAASILRSFSPALCSKAASCRAGVGAMARARAGRHTRERLTRGLQTDCPSTGAKRFARRFRDSGGHRRRAPHRASDRPEALGGSRERDSAVRILRQNVRCSSLWAEAGSSAVNERWTHTARSRGICGAHSVQGQSMHGWKQTDYSHMSIWALTPTYWPARHVLTRGSERDMGVRGAAKRCCLCRFPVAEQGPIRLKRPSFADRVGRRAAAERIDRRRAFSRAARAPGQARVQREALGARR